MSETRDMRKVARYLGKAVLTACGWNVLLSALIVIPGPLALMAGTNAIFSSTYLGSGNFDASVGLDATKTYHNAVNLNGGALTNNGVFFEASSGGSPTGTTWSFINEGSVMAGGVANNLTGQLGSLVNDFIYGGNPGWMILSNLTVGETYILTFYNRSYEAAGSGVRVQTLITSSGASVVFDEDIGAPADGYGNLLRYTFAATGATESVMFSPNSSGTLHLYGFSTERVFNKSWGSGAGWSGATWSPSGAPNGVGFNASFTAAAISSPATITLDGPIILGHLQFAGTNAYTIAGGGNALTMQADIGGVACINTTNGSHFISAPVVLNSEIEKFGNGTLEISGDITGSDKGLNICSGGLVLSGSNNNLGAIVNNDALTISNSAALVMAGAIRGAGSLEKKGTGTLTLSGSNTCSGQVIIGGGTLAISNSGVALYGAISGSGLLLKSGGGTMYMTGTNSNTGDTCLNAGILKMGAGSVVVSNYSFEMHDSLSNGNFQYQPTGAGWVFAANAGINSNGGPFCTPVAPDGVAEGFIQGAGNGISQSITVSTDGFYNISFQAVGRAGYGANGLLIQIDGTTVRYIDEGQISVTVWQNYLVRTYITAGVHVLAFAGINRYGGDRTTCIDNISFAAPAGRLSTNSVLKIASGAVFDPCGSTQSVQRLLLGGQPQFRGTYGASGSGAQYTNNTYFTGAGMIDVQHGPVGMVVIIR